MVVLVGTAPGCRRSCKRPDQATELDCLQLANSEEFREGLPDSVMLSSCQCTGIWKQGVLRTKDTEYAVQCTYADGSGNGYLRRLSSDVLERQAFHSGEKLELMNAPGCSGRSLWGAVSNLVGRDAALGTMSISSAGFRWTLSQTGARSIVAIADQPCEALSVALEESIDGYYVDTLHRAPGYEPARLETCAGDEFIAPFGGALDERIWSAIAAQIPRELEPFDPTVGSLNQYVGDGWRTREETRGQEVRVFIRAKIRWTATQDNRTLPKTQLLEINDARVPGQSEKCAAKTADE